jgi:hypothetical protein
MFRSRRESISGVCYVDVDLPARLAIRVNLSIRGWFDTGIYGI